MLHFVYTRLGEETSCAESRTVRLLALAFWSGVWTLSAWDEARNDFRSFRIDRIAEVRRTGETFEEERGKRFSDFMKRVRAEAGTAARLASKPPT